MLKDQIRTAITREMDAIDDVRDSPITVDAALERFKTLGTKWGASMNLNIDHDGDGECYISAGDCNCPIVKPYDPSDGHGYTSVDTDEHIEFTGFTPTEAILFACYLFERAQVGDYDFHPFTPGHVEHGESFCQICANMKRAYEHSKS